MYLSRLTSLFALSLVVLGQDVLIPVVEEAFREANIPTDLNIVFNPTALLEVSLPQAIGLPIILHAGMQVPRDDTAGPPSFNIVTVGNAAMGQGPFVIAMADPDAPTPQDRSTAQVRHFLGGDFNINEGGRLVSSTPAISQYIQPTPEAESDAHRYILLLFNQSPQFAQQTVVGPTSSIYHFNISEFASALGLGDPVAGTFMLVAPNPT